MISQVLIQVEQQKSWVHTLTTGALSTRPLAAPASNRRSSTGSTTGRKYGDALNHEDLYGFKQRRRRKMRQTGEMSLGGATEDGNTEM